MGGEGDLGLVLPCCSAPELSRLDQNLQNLQNLRAVQPKAVSPMKKAPQKGRAISNSGHQSLAVLDTSWLGRPHVGRNGENPQRFFSDLRAVLLPEKPRKLLKPG